MRNYNWTEVEGGILEVFPVGLPIWVCTWMSERRLPLTLA